MSYGTRKRKSCVRRIMSYDHRSRLEGHVKIGWFLTHSGFGSVIESLVEGVPFDYLAHGR